MKTWLMRVIAAAILCTIAQDLSPKGSVKQVGRLVCAMVLLCVVLSPVKTLDMAAGSQWLTNYRRPWRTAGRPWRSRGRKSKWPS